MTKHEQILAHLDAIEALLEKDEPGSVLNELAKENRWLRRARLQAEERIRELEHERATNESYIESLRQRLAHKHRTLAQVCNQVKGLQHTLEDPL